MRAVFSVIILLASLLVSTQSLAAICFVGGQVGSFAGVTSNQTINFALTGGDVACADTAPQTGDNVIITYGVSATGDNPMIVDAPDTTDYTPLREGYASDTFDANMLAAYRVMPSPTETQVLLGCAGAPCTGGGTGSTNNAGAYVIHVLRNVHATPLEQAVQGGSLFNTSEINPGSITPTTTGTWVYVSGVGALAAGAHGNYVSSDLSRFLTTSQDDTNAVNIGAGLFEWSSGTFSPATWTGGGTAAVTDSGQWLIAAFAPAADGAPSVRRGLLIGVY